MTGASTDRPVVVSRQRTAVSEWLAEFEKALTIRDIDAAARLFVDDCYWRDLVAFTWNIVTVEGVEGVRHMLGKTLDQVQPSGFAVTDELGEAGGPTELDNVRDLGRTRRRSSPAQRQQSLDAADAERSQRPRGAEA